jgi:DNA-binding NtrC family response regulator
MNANDRNEADMHHTSDAANDDPRSDPAAVVGKEHRDLPDNRLCKLLLVDDEADGAAFAAALLSSHGLEVVVVHSANEALRTLQYDNDIDAVLSDVVMPGMTGLQLADEISVRYPTVKIILMSGYAVRELLGDRDHQYLFAPKPYRIDTLLELLHR